jgi:hypothetical protein
MNMRKTNPDGSLTPEQIEEDYLLGKECQRLGYIKSNWKCPPEKLCGESILKLMKERSK